MIRPRHLARRAAWALLIGLLVAQTVRAQPARPAMDPSTRIERMASDLDLDAGQRSALRSIADRYSEPAPGDLWSLAADVEAVLTDAQVAQLREGMQTRREEARVERREVRQERAPRRARSERSSGDRAARPGRERLTDDQRQALRDLAADVRPRARSLVESFQAGALTDDAFLAQAQALREEAADRLGQILPAEAQARLSEAQARRAAVEEARAAALGLTPEQREAFQSLVLDRLRTAPDRPGRDGHRARRARPSGEERSQMRERRQDAKDLAEAILSDRQRDVLTVHTALAGRSEGARGRMRRGRHAGAGPLGRMLGPINRLATEGVAAGGAHILAADAPAELAVEAVVPNPGADLVRVVYALPETATARVEVFDVQGRRVAVLADGAQRAGRHEAALDARALSPGVYVVRVAAAGARAERSFTVAQ